MENSTKIEDTKEVENKEVENKEIPHVDYEKINQQIKQNVETEVGKFIRNFMENNTSPKKEVEDEVINEQERELREWRI